MADLELFPKPGAKFVRHAGDLFSFTLSGTPTGFAAKLRTNLGRGERLREEVVRAHFGRLPLAGASWRDIPMRADGPGRWALTVPLTEVGFFKAKAYAVDPQGRQHWPPGPDICLSVHPSWTRTANTIYCAFPRMFGKNKTKRQTISPELDARLAPLDAEGYAVIPPGGKLRDLTRELPHILGQLGCRILHLLPINPTPTTFARFGRFGSPYALQHLTAIDPALIEFDRRTTGLDQFSELAYQVHRSGARLMLDVVINHTGWGSALWEDHPEWFVRKPDGQFESPGAWDVVWEDLVELDQRHVPLWEHVAEAFLTWCRRGVDGFRCDAGYQIPVHVWQFITARVREEFPETVFLLEGLGGSWEATEALLGDGGMQWAYSELFQNFTGESVGGYLDHTFSSSAKVGTLVHYSETHDNSRLAAHPVPGVVAAEPPPPNLAWSRLRNRLCALTSVNGCFGFACGVEWAATEQINVHSARGMAWG
ncbi:MAG TPA: amylo-alpha-1,6-glucosidase, partial [Verrucomicrobiales bacterium]|nr:amylo-alpha-1,6-glucosidase [Verrucomicrobiales bacterium]